MLRTIAYVHGQSTPSSQVLKLSSTKQRVYAAMPPLTLQHDECRALRGTTTKFCLLRQDVYASILCYFNRVSIRLYDSSGPSLPSHFDFAARIRVNDPAGVAHAARSAAGCLSSEVSRRAQTACRLGTSPWPACRCWCRRKMACGCLRQQAMNDPTAHVHRAHSAGWCRPEKRHMKVAHAIRR